MNYVSHYHPLLVTLHWVLAALIIAELALGFFGLAALSNPDPRNIGILRAHMLGGMLILVLMVIRFVVRVSTSRPAEATTDHQRFDRIAPITHCGFYVGVVLMAGTGFATAIIADLGELVFGEIMFAPLPRTLIIYPTFVAHAVVGKLLVGFVILHVVAACYHQFIRKDALFQRMLFRRRVSDTVASAE
jgi:cytochrome b561